MEQILDMMKTWTPFGQGFFLLLIVGGTYSFIATLFRYFVVLFRGWPSSEAEEEE